MNQLSKIRITALVAVILALGACQKEKQDTVVRSSFDSAFQLAVSQTALVSSNSEQLSIEAKYINDMRCSTCSDPGNVLVRVVVSNLKDAVSETTLNIGNFNGEVHQIDTVTVDLKGHAYKLILRNVSAERKAEFMVRKLD
jgi:hypothetical protein